MPRSPSADAFTQVITLRVTLHPQEISPPIWRELWVDGSMSLAKLHHFLQAAFGWHDSHLHEFLIGDKVYRQPDPEMDSPDRPIFDERRTVLSKLLRVGDHFTYVYDFGDHWEHVIKVMSIEAVEGIAPGNGYVTAGARCAPPEDVGGVPGYEDFLEQILARPIDHEGLRLLGWAGGSFDPEQFDMRAANAAIQRMLWNHWGGR